MEKYSLFDKIREIDEQYCELHNQVVFYDKQKELVVESIILYKEVLLWKC